ncbi:MAG TPA: hypothetical protein PLW93_05675 [Candidatus Absconditabacterales bacterium]|nr:hypothetical protein [Candidatus Absconditabacterales bacterium]HNG97735.1 hypothetical protein [Candidatus Absconditabacterales bacterium]
MGKKITIDNTSENFFFAWKARNAASKLAKEINGEFKDVIPSPSST